MQHFGHTWHCLLCLHCLRRHHKSPAGYTCCMNGCCFNTPDGQPLRAHATNSEPITYVPVKDKVLTSRQYKAMLRARRAARGHDYYV